MRMTITNAAILAMLFAVSGCVGGDVHPGYELAAMSKPPVADIPVPLGFKLDEGSSRSCDSGVARFVDHLYLGSASKYAVSRFYKKAMVSQKWRFVSETSSLGDQDLRFDRPGETCKVTITSGSWLHPTKLKVQLWTSELKKRPVNGTGKTGQ